MPTKSEYPSAIWYIFGNEFCERFSYHGLKAILVLFLISLQKYDYETAATIFHTFLVFAYVTPFFGGILSDSYWGKYKTIYILSIVHALGNIVVALASMFTSVDLQFQRILAIIGLVLLAIGVGGIKPCVSSFGGDQFVLPDQEELLRKFFSIFYFSVNAGSLVSTFVSPELRKSVQCFGQDTCFPLAFGLPAVLMMISIVLFVLGKSHYTMKKPVSSVVAISIGCMFHAMKRKLTAPSNVRKKKDWLEYASDKYDKNVINDLRVALDVMVMFTTVPIYSALTDQQGSSWVVQATLMNGRIDFLNWTLKPDQVHIINPLFILIFLPLFESVVYPILYKIGVSTPLRKITVGGLINALSFVCAAFVQYEIMGENITLSPNEGHIQIYNSIDCNITVSNNFVGNFVVEPMNMFQIDYNQGINETEILSVDLDHLCRINATTMAHRVSGANGKISSYFLTQEQGDGVELRYLNEMKKLKSGKANLRILHDSYSCGETIVLREMSNKNNLSDIVIQLSSNLDQNYEIPVGTYNVYQYFNNNERILKEVVFFPFSVNNLWLYKNFNRTNAKLITLDKGKYIHMLWQFPQVIIITIAEAMVVVTLFEFAYTQAPISMKSFVSSVFMALVGLGNLLIIIMSKLRLFENQGHEFMFYAVLMALSMVVFIFLSIKYKYKCITDTQSKTEQPFLNG